MKDLNATLLQETDSSAVYELLDQYTNPLYDDSLDLDQIHTVDYVQPFQISYALCALFAVLSVVSFGVLPLVCHWYPYVFLRLTHVRSTNKKATAMVSQSTLTKQRTSSRIKRLSIKNGDQLCVCRMQFIHQRRPLKLTVVYDQVVRMYQYRNVNYLYDDRIDKYVRVAFNSSLAFKKLKTLSGGVDPVIRELRTELFGKNGANIRVKSPYILLLDEVLHPFFIFQVASIIIWCLSEYYLFSGVILASAAISSLMTLIETRSNMLNLRDMAQDSCVVNRVVDGVGEKVQSENLVPGDIIELEPGMSTPCDIVVISGEAVMNESMLTGESIPVVKNAIPDEDEVYSIDKHKNFTCFAGTQIVQTSTRGDERVLGICVRTGFETAKGKLVLSILFPRPTEFKYYRDAFRFVGILFSIGTLGMIYCVIRYSLMRIIGAEEIVMRALNLTTIIVPPASPVAITVGTAVAVSKLKKRKIFTISPSRINVAGIINCMCFDKTGTLTEDGLDLSEIKISDDSVFKDSVNLIDMPAFVENNSYGTSVSSVFLYTLTACNSLTKHENELIGDPLEQAVFAATGWELEEPHEMQQEALIVARTPLSRAKDRAEVGIIKRFDFSSDLKRMSVVVKDFNFNTSYAIVKGSPEHLRALCRPDSIPSDYDSVLFNYTYKGFRVLSVGYKPVDSSREYSRSEVESDLHFIGFIVMQNKMKSDTPTIIKQLTAASVETSMVTGDNALTGIYVAREAGIVRTDKVYLGDVHGEDIRWKDVESDLELDPVTLKPVENHTFCLAITGAAFELLYRRHYSETYGKDDVPFLHKVLVQCRVYARMSPDQKRVVSEELQKIDYFVGFCGDGANDTASLKASHIGISLSQAEASIAAPFTSITPTIACVPIVIREGRASLATSFQLFKYMTCYSVIQFVAIIILYEKNTTLGNYQFLMLDMFIILPIVFLLSKTPASRVLTDVRPSGSLLNPLVLTSLVGQILIAVAFQILVFFRLRNQSWFVPLVPEVDATENVVCAETTVVFWMAAFETYAIAFAYSISRPWKRPLFYNKTFALALTLIGAYLSYIVIWPDKFTTRWLELDIKAIPLAFRFEVLLYVYFYVLASFCYEFFVISGPGKKIMMAFVKRRAIRLIKDIYASDYERHYHKLRLSRKRFNQIKFKMLEKSYYTSERAV